MVRGPTKETPHRAIQILSNRQTAALIEAAQGTAALPYFALGIFAGIRPAEMDRLTLRDVDLKKRLVIVSHVTSKTKRKRFVDISENLAALIEAHEADEDSGIKEYLAGSGIAFDGMAQGGSARKARITRQNRSALGKGHHAATFGSNHLAYH